MTQLTFCTPFFWLTKQLHAIALVMYAGFESERLRMLLRHAVSLIKTLRTYTFAG